MGYILSWPFRVIGSVIELVFRLVGGLVGAVFGVIGGLIGFILNALTFILFVALVWYVVRLIVRGIRSSR